MGRHTKVPIKLYRSKSNKNMCNHKCPLEALKSKSSEQCIRPNKSHECDYCNGLFPIENEEETPSLTKERVSFSLIIILNIYVLIFIGRCLL